MLSYEQAIQKLKHYCAYQERSHYEVKQKLWELEVSKKEHDAVISVLIEEDYLNEERFAILYAGGKWRMKQWGKRKILQGLKERQVSEYNIKKAMKQIDDEDYIKTIEKLVTKKYQELKKEQHFIRKRKTLNYMLSRGFEADLVNDELKKLSAS